MAPREAPGRRRAASRRDLAEAVAKRDRPLVRLDHVVDRLRELGPVEVAGLHRDGEVSETREDEAGGLEVGFPAEEGPARARHIAPHRLAARADPAPLRIVEPGEGERGVETVPGAR